MTRWNNITISDAIERRMQDTKVLDVKNINFGQSSDQKHDRYSGYGKFSIDLNLKKVKDFLSDIIGKDAEVSQDGDILEIEHVQMDPEKRLNEIEKRSCIDISVCILKLSSFVLDERIFLVQYADLISQNDSEKKIILYSSSVEQILELLETDEEYIDEDYTNFKVLLNELIQMDVDQYIFD